MRLTELVKPKVLAAAWKVSTDMVFDVARREGIPVLELGYRTRRILASDVNRLQEALLRRAAHQARVRRTA